VRTAQPPRLLQQWAWPPHQIKRAPEPNSPAPRFRLRLKEAEPASLNIGFDSLHAPGTPGLPCAAPCEPEPLGGPPSAHSFRHFRGFRFGCLPFCHSECPAEFGVPRSASPSLRFISRLMSTCQRGSCWSPPRPVPNPLPPGLPTLSFVGPVQALPPPREGPPHRADALNAVRAPRTGALSMKPWSARLPWVPAGSSGTSRRTSPSGSTGSWAPSARRRAPPPAPTSTGSPRAARTSRPRTGAAPTPRPTSPRRAPSACGWPAKPLLRSASAAAGSLHSWLYPPKPRTGRRRLGLMARTAPVMISLLAAMCRWGWPWTFSVTRTDWESLWPCLELQGEGVVVGEPAKCKMLTCSVSHIMT
jgi:hypothetical protein